MKVFLKIWLVACMHQFHVRMIWYLNKVLYDLTVNFSAEIIYKRLNQFVCITNIFHFNYIQYFEMAGN